MCKLQYQPFNKLPASDRAMIAKKFQEGDKAKQKIIRLPAIGAVWLLVPEGKTYRQIIRAQRMIKNFGTPKSIISTEVPAKFLQSAVA